MILGLLSFSLLTACQSIGRQVSINITPTQSVKVEVVASELAVSQGLSGRLVLADNEGMLFVFKDSQQRSFWMKDMQFNLDIIWLNKGKIVDIWSNAPKSVLGQIPAQYQSPNPADMVLEVVAGQSSVWGLKIGDTISLPSKLDLLRVAR